MRVTLKSLDKTASSGSWTWQTPMFSLWNYANLALLFVALFNIHDGPRRTIDN